MSTTVNDDRTAERLREAWQLHELGYFGAAVLTARLAIEQAMVDQLGEDFPECSKPSARQLAGRLQSKRRISGNTRERVYRVYSLLSEVAHGKPIGEKDSYDLIVWAGEVRDLIVEPAPQLARRLDRQAASRRLATTS